MRNRKVERLTLKYKHGSKNKRYESEPGYDRNNHGKINQVNHQERDTRRCYNCHKDGHIERERAKEDNVSIVEEETTSQDIVQNKSLVIC